MSLFCTAVRDGVDEYSPRELTDHDSSDTEDQRRHSAIAATAHDGSLTTDCNSSSSSSSGGGSGSGSMLTTGFHDYANTTDVALPEDNTNDIRMLATPVDDG